MLRPHPLRRRLRQRAVLALASFVAALCVTLLAPFVQAADYELVCSVQGNKLVAHDTAGHTIGADHAAHCPLCMPAGAPPSTVAWDATPVQPLAHVRQSIPAARLASLVGAALPARGPPQQS